MIIPDKPPLASLAHYGVKGMKWGVRKKASSGARKAGTAAKTAAKKVGKALEGYENERRRLQGEAFITDLFGLNSPARAQLNAYDAMEKTIISSGARAAQRLLKVDD